MKVLSAFLLCFVCMILMASSVVPASYNLVQNAGTPLTRRSTLNCINGTTCADTGGVTTISSTAIAGNYSQSFTSQTSVVLTHNLNTLNVIVACYDTSTPPVQIIPNTTSITDVNDVTVTFSIAQSGYCTVNGLNVSGGGGGGGSTTNSGAYASLPAAGHSGNLYLVTDAPYLLRDNGAPWNAFYKGTAVRLGNGLSWTVVDNSGSSPGVSLSTTTGAMVLSSGQQASGDCFVGAYLAAPATPYNVDLGPFVANVPFVFYGMSLRDSATGNIITFRWNGTSNPQYIIDQWSAGGPGCGGGYNGNVYTGGTSITPTLGTGGCMRISNDGTTRKFFVSADCLNFTQVYSQSAGTYITETQVGFVGDNGNSVGANIATGATGNLFVYGAYVH
jgi:hypothetical protein